MPLFAIWLQSRGLTWDWHDVISHYCLFLPLPASLTCLSPLGDPENNYHDGMWPGLGFVQVVKANIIKTWDLVILGQSW